MANCIFCQPLSARKFLANDLAYVLWDGFPVTPLHALVVPIRHVADYFSLAAKERRACDELLLQARDQIETQDPTVAGFNIGVNVGNAAGQTIFHCHIHLIPRRVGDVAEPRGGVRHVIPGKGNY